MGAGRKAAENFQRVFRNRQVPEDMKQFEIARASEDDFFVRELEGNIVGPRRVPENELQKWTKVLVALQQVASVSEAERIIKQKGFEIDGKTIVDPAHRLELNRTARYEVRVGKKKFLRIVVQ